MIFTDLLTPLRFSSFYFQLHFVYLVFMTTDIKRLDYFRFSIGGYHSGRAEIIIEDGFFSAQEFDYILSDKIDKLGNLFSVEDELKLIKTLNAINTHSWKPKYTNNDVMDGTDWELEMRINKIEKLYTFYGSNEYPQTRKIISNSKKSTIIEYSEDFLLLLKTLNKITKTKYFK